MSDHESGETKATRQLFDLRTVIGGLFAVYGLVCLIWGLVSYTAADKAKTGNINLNLWAGIGMLVVSALFLVWAFTRPLQPDAPADTDAGGPGAGATRADR